MLVLTRKPGEQVIVGNNVVITVIELRNGRVRLGFEAPSDMPIIRPDAIDKRKTI